MATGIDAQLPAQYTAVASRRLTLKSVSGEWAVCRLPPNAAIPALPPECEFFSVTRTPDELSIVTPAQFAPVDARVESGFACVKVDGPLEFSETGVLAGLAEPLAQSGVSVFVVSTFDTDYLFVKNRDLAAAKELWTKKGHQCL